MECLKVVCVGGGGQGDYSSVVEHCEKRHVNLGTILSSTHNTQRKWGTGGGVQRFRTLALPEVGCSEPPGTQGILLPSFGFCGYLYTWCTFIK